MENKTGGKLVTVGSRSLIPVRKARAVRIEPAEKGGPGYLRPTLSSISRGASTGSVKYAMEETTECECGAEKLNGKPVVNKNRSQTYKVKNGQQPSKIPLKEHKMIQCMCNTKDSKNEKLQIQDGRSSNSSASDEVQQKRNIAQKTLTDMDAGLATQASAALLPTTATENETPCSFVPSSNPGFSKYRSVNLIPIPEYENPFEDNNENEARSPFNSPGGDSSRRTTRAAATPLATLCERFNCMELSTPTIRIPFEPALYDVVNMGDSALETPKSITSNYYTPCGKSLLPLESDVSDTSIYYTPPTEPLLDSAETKKLPSLSNQ